MQDNELIAFLGISASLFLFSTIWFAVAWVRTRERAIKAEARLSENAPLPGVRTERMEQAIDAIASEVERLAESQRFTARLLAERDGVPLPARPRLPELPERQITPQ